MNIASAGLPQQIIASGTINSKESWIHVFRVPPIVNARGVTLKVSSSSFEYSIVDIMRDSPVVEAYFRKLITDAPRPGKKPQIADLSTIIPLINANRSTWQQEGLQPGMATGLDDGINILTARVIYTIATMINRCTPQYPDARHTRYRLEWHAYYDGFPDALLWCVIHKLLQYLTRSINKRGVFDTRLGVQRTTQEYKKFTSNPGGRMLILLGLLEDEAPGNETNSAHDARAQVQTTDKSDGFQTSETINDVDTADDDTQPSDPLDSAEATDAAGDPNITDTVDKDSQPSDPIEGVETADAAQIPKVDRGDNDTHPNGPTEGAEAADNAATADYDDSDENDEDVFYTPYGSPSPQHSQDNQTSDIQTNATQETPANDGSAARDTPIRFDEIERQARESRNKARIDAFQYHGLAFKEQRNVETDLAFAEDAYFYPQ